jgi:hypothetical protein
MSKLKLFLQDYAVHHHRLYTVSHSDQNLRYCMVCKASYFVEGMGSQEIERWQMEDK